jgi:phosphatidylinositol alpha-1,6-mannosyltransferase
MNALYVACPVVRGAGGIAGYTRAVLSATGPHPVDVLSQGAEKPLFELPAHARLLGSPRRQAAFAARFAADALRRGPTTFVFAHLGLIQPLALLPRLSRHRMIVLLHGIEAWSRLSARRGLALDRIDSFVATTVFTREMFSSANQGRFRADATFPVIPLSAAADVEEAAPTPAPTGPRRRILCVTRLTLDEPLKGLATLLEAARLLDPARYEVVIAGDGPGRERLLEKARELGIFDRVRFTGWVSDAERARLLGEADVFCLPSAQEGFGIVFLEAMAAGRPCVGAAAGAVPEVLAPEVGELFPFGDAAALARALARAADRLRTGELTPAGIRAFYDARFSFGRFRTAWHDLLGLAAGSR